HTDCLATFVFTHYRVFWWLLSAYTTLFRSGRRPPAGRAGAAGGVRLHRRGERGGEGGGARPPHPRRRRRGVLGGVPPGTVGGRLDRKSTRLNSSHVKISYAVFCLKK